MNVSAICTNLALVIIDTGVIESRVGTDDNISLVPRPSILARLGGSDVVPPLIMYASRWLSMA